MQNEIVMAVDGRMHWVAFSEKRVGLDLESEWRADGSTALDRFRVVAHLLLLLDRRATYVFQSLATRVC
jgi:hypothetical protein